MRLSRLLNICFAVIVGMYLSSTAHSATPDSREAIVPIVDAALQRPMADLYARAQSGEQENLLIFRLALKAGREAYDKGAFGDPAPYYARLEAAEMGFYERWKPVKAKPSQRDMERLSILTAGHMDLCTPCRPLPKETDASDAGYAAYLRMNDIDVWRNQKGGATKEEINAAVTAIFCIGGLERTLRLEAAYEWLEADRATATGRRATLNAAVQKDMELWVGPARLSLNACPASEVERWQRTLKEQRPELKDQVARYLERRLGDPRLPVNASDEPRREPGRF